MGEKTFTLTCNYFSKPTKQCSLFILFVMKHRFCSFADHNSFSNYKISGTDPENGLCLQTQLLQSLHCKLRYMQERIKYEGWCEEKPKHLEGSSLF